LETTVGWWSRDAQGTEAASASWHDDLMTWSAEKRWLLDEAGASLREMEMLQSIAAEAAAEVDSDRILQLVARRTREFTEAEASLVALQAASESGRNTFVVRAASGDAAEERVGQAISPGVPLEAGEVRVLEEPQGTLAGYGAPVLVARLAQGDRELGVLVIARPAAYEAARRMQLAAQTYAGAVERAILVEAERRAAHDREALLERERQARAAAEAAVEAHRQAEAALRVSEDAQRTLAIENARLYEKAQEALRARDALFASVSHDLRTPLTAVKGFIQAIQARVRSRGLGEHTWLVDNLDQAQAAATRMVAMLDELADAPLMQSGRALSLDCRAMDLVTLARTVVKEQSSLSSMHRCTLVTEATDLAGVWDRNRLRRVLDNLIGNAIKYSPAGSPVTVTLRSVLDNGGQRRWAEVVVADQGRGISDEDLPHIFELFRRGSNVGSVTGMGVGLAGVKQIVEQHGGTIAVQSAAGQGTTFVVRLPMS
jgi:signal transduction histidine kinase